MTWPWVVLIIAGLIVLDNIVKNIINGVIAIRAKEQEH